MFCSFFSKSSSEQDDPAKGRGELAFPSSVSYLKTYRRQAGTDPQKKPAEKSLLRRRERYGGILMKRAMIALVSAALATTGLSTVGFGAETEKDWYPTYEQTASAWLDQDGTEVRVTVYLSDGWSVYFARGAAYLYDGPADDNADAAAIGITLDEEVFNEYVADARSHDSYREFARSFTYTEDDGSNLYFFTVGPDAYFMIDVSPEADGDAVSSRFSVEPSDYVEPDTGE